MKLMFCKNDNKSLFDKLVLYFTKSKFSHAALIIDDTIDGDAIVVEATARHGIGFNLLSHFSHREVEIYEDVNGIRDINALKPYIGHNYGYLQLLGIALVKIFKLKKNPFPDNEVCSELVLDWLLASQYSDEFKHLDPDTVSPGDLYDIVSKSPNFRKL